MTQRGHRRRHRPSILTLQRAVVVVWLSVVAAVPAAPGLAAVTFTVTPSASEYDLTEPILLTLTLHVTNDTPTAVTISKDTLGTISVVTATWDDTPITPRRKHISFEELPTQVDTLSTLAPGTSEEIPSSDLLLDYQGVARLVVVRREPTILIEPQRGLFGPLRNLNPFRRQQWVLWEYALPGPGLYTLQLRYQYTGPADAQQTVFRDPVLSNVVQFLRR